MSSITYKQDNDPFKVSSDTKPQPLSTNFTDLVSVSETNKATLYIDFDSMKIGATTTSSNKVEGNMNVNDDAYIQMKLAMEQ